MLALVEGNAWGWGSVRVLGLLGLSLAGIRAFNLVEQRSSNPMIEYRFFRSRTFLGTNGVAFCVSIAMLAMFFFMALYLQNILA